MTNKDLEVIKDVMMNQQELLDDLSFEKNFIRSFYSKYDKQDFDELVCSGRAEQVFKESMLEKNVDSAEVKGLNQAYTDIYNYNYTQKRGGKPLYDLYVTVGAIHRTLYKFTDHPEFGDSWRNSNAILLDNPIDVPSWDQAQLEFFKLRDEFNFLRDNTDEIDIIEYIDRSVKLTTEIIRIQPFADGNKRTSRALLMLMLRKAKIPPFSMNKIEKKEYSRALDKAMAEQDYQDLNDIVYTKIADSILNFNSSKQLKERTKKVMLGTVENMLSTYNIAEANYDERQKKEK